MSFERIQKMLASQKVPHAFLFIGPENSGQKEAVMKLAMALFCDKPSASRTPCVECIQCRQLSQNAHPDFNRVEPEADAVGISVEVVRQAIGKANLRPFQAKAKLFLIEGAERLNDTGQNALLKTLEEPAPNTYFVLTVKDGSQLLETIRSRAQSIYFSAVGERAELEGDALQFGEAMIRTISESSFDILRAPEATGLERKEIGAAFDHVISFFREVLVLKADAGEILGHTDRRNQKQRFADEHSEEELIYILENLSLTKDQITDSMANAKAALVCLWDNLRNLPAGRQEQNA